MFDFLTHRFSDAFAFLTGKKKLTEQNIADVIQKVRDALIDADVPHKTVEAFIEQIRSEALGAAVLKSMKPDEQFAKVVHDKLALFLGATNSFSFALGRKMLMVGLQGSGKTTTVAKLAYLFKEHHKKNLAILVGSVDFYRPAAVEQLSILAGQLNIDFYRPLTTDPIQETRNFMRQAQSKKYDLVILDTAGRLHIDNAMLTEVKDIHAIVQPTDTILVVDAMTGQESLSIARAFDQAIGFGGAILTKMDSNTRGGVAFAFRYELHKEIWCVGTGEKHDQIELFHGDRLAKRLIGMGDLETLVERAEKKIERDDADSLEKSFNSGKITLDDFAIHLRSMTKLGSMGQLLRYLPGMPKQALSQEKINEADRELKKFLAIISSMNGAERVNPKIVNSSRRKRIARGAGVVPEDVVTLLDRFEQMNQFVKLLGNSGSLKQFMKR